MMTTLETDAKTLDHSGFGPVSLHQIRVGGILQQPIYDQNHVLLIAEHQMVTETFLEHLRGRGVSQLLVHEEDLPRVLAGSPRGDATDIPETPPAPLACQDQNEQTRQLDAELAAPGALQLPPQETAFLEQLKIPERTVIDEQVRTELIEHQQRAVSQVQSVFEGLLGGANLDLSTLTDITDEALADLSEDVDIFASLGLNPFDGEYPARHCMHSCMLALSIGVNLRLDKRTLKELALGCLIHDAGMLRINPQIAAQTRPLTRMELLEVAKHPVKVFDLVRSMEQIPKRSAFIAYQVHERNDGSGYPRGRTDNQIHFLSKIAAVADMYAALVAPRPYRPAILPARALEAVIAEGNAHRLDAGAVRALVQTTSLYPLGSYVLLSDGRVAQTVRSNGVEFDRPVVKAWRVGELNRSPDVIDLLATPDIGIVQAIPRLSMTQEELSQTTSPTAAAGVQLAHLLNLSEQQFPADGSERRQSIRREFVRRVVLFPILKDGTVAAPRATYARNLSASGMAMLDNHELESEELVIALQSTGIKPIFLRSFVVRREKIREEWWEYGLRFGKRVTDPTVMRLEE